MDRDNAAPSDNTGVVVIVFTVPTNGADAMPAGNYLLPFFCFSVKILEYGHYLDILEDRCHSLPMPLYEFQCVDCEKPSELLVRSSDFSGEKCPYCGSSQLVKQLSTFAPATPIQAEVTPQCTGNPGACGMCQ